MYLLHLYEFYKPVYSLALPQGFKKIHKCSLLTTYVYKGTLDGFSIKLKCFCISDMQLLGITVAVISNRIESWVCISCNIRPVYLSSEASNSR